MLLDCTYVGKEKKNEFLQDRLHQGPCDSPQCVFFLRSFPRMVQVYPLPSEGFEHIAPLLNPLWYSLKYELSN